ncbi:hypothetical protein ABZ876_27420 [Streptomyces sp. NPDC046931]|uniref:hypothetical protein n=1 Tax=Streptomyces sp. NPDC046931 TaxID=3154806 RepID=UPI0033E67ABB
MSATALPALGQMRRRPAGFGVLRFADAVALDLACGRMIGFRSGAAYRNRASGRPPGRTPPPTGPPIEAGVDLDRLGSMPLRFAIDRP